jgi:hypothetical protein
MKAKHIFIILGIVLLIAIAVVFSLGLVRFLTIDMASRPSIEFLQPLHGNSVPFGDALVRFSVRDREGIEHIELWVDGELYAARQSSLEEGSNPFPFVEMWQPDSLGEHTLTARAYNTKNRESAASVVVHVIETPTVSEVPPGGEPSLNPPEDDETPPADVVEGSEVPALLIDPSIAIRPLDGFLSNPAVPLMGMLPRLKLADEAIPRSGFVLEVEALYLEVDRPYDGVFCYISLAGSDQERVPLNDGEYFLPDLGNLWDIKRELAGDNKRTVYLDEGADALDVYLNCWGKNDDAGAVYELGTLTDAHYSEAWDGRLIEQEVYGPSGWFRVGYQIHPPAPPGPPDSALPTPTLSYNCFELPYTGSCDLIWNYPDTAREEIDGFIIMLNGEFLLYKSGRYRNKWMVSEALGTVPTCGRTFHYQVIAYKDDPILGEKSLPSNTAAITGDPCYYAVEVQFEHVIPWCLDGDHDANCSACFDICDHVCGMDPDDFYAWQDEVGPDVPFGPCFEAYMNSDWDHQRLVPNDDEGCSYAKLWANEETISIGEMGPSFGYCLNLSDRTRYRVSEISVGDRDTVRVPLEVSESLVIGLNWYDDDSSTADDLQCYGEFTYNSRDILEIAALPGRQKSYSRIFSERGGGDCAIQYTIKVFLLTPPSE